jgi:hypothetical protein
LKPSPDFGQTGDLHRHELSLSIFEQFSGRFQREYKGVKPRPIWKTSTGEKVGDGFLIETKLSSKGLAHIIRVLKGKKEAMHRYHDPRELVEAAAFFDEWEIRAPLAGTLASLRYIFIEQKNCPNDTLLTMAWQLTDFLEHSRLRLLLLSSLWRRILYDDDFNPVVTPAQFFGFYHNRRRRDPSLREDLNFVDLRPTSWFSDFHAFCNSLHRSCMDTAFLAMRQAREDSKSSPLARVNALLHYINELLRRRDENSLPAGVVLDDDKFAGLELVGYDESNTKKGAWKWHMEYLKTLELSQFETQDLPEPISRRPHTFEATRMPLSRVRHKMTRSESLRSLRHQLLHPPSPMH